MIPFNKGCCVTMGFDWPNVVGRVPLVPNFQAQIRPIDGLNGRNVDGCCVGIDREFVCDGSHDPIRSRFGIREWRLGLGRLDLRECPGWQVTPLG